MSITTPVYRKGKHYTVIVSNGQSLMVFTNQDTLNAQRQSDLSHDHEILVWSWIGDAGFPARYTTGKWVRLDSLGLLYNSMGVESARTLAAAGHNVALINVAYGGRGLNAYWRKGQAGYTILTGQINTALSALSFGNTWEWGFFLRYQAHADCGNVSDAETYATLLPTHMADLRADLTGATDLTFVIGRAPDWASSIRPADALASIRAAQVSIAEADGNATWFDTDGCLVAGTESPFTWTATWDGTHPTAPARARNGMRGANAWLAM